MKKGVLLIPAVILALVLAGFAAQDDGLFALRKNFQIFSSLYEELVGGYVDDLDPEKLMRAGIDAMLADLDPYTVFYDEADNTEIDIITRGRYAGVGLNVGVRAGRITVLAPLEGTSAYRQGIRTGDVILRIAGQSTDGLTVDDLGTLLHGEPGTAVEVEVERTGRADPLTFRLTREEVRLKNVSYAGFVDDDTLSGIGYVRLERFARDAPAEMRRSLSALQSTGALNGLVVDLRDNPGGLLDAAVDIAQLFVPEGSVIVSTRGRPAETDHAYRSQASPLFPDVPLVVLINAYSASASEILAGAVQDLDRGVVVGEASYGKGLVQVIKPLPFNTSLKMTTARYYTPSGRSIQALDYGDHDGSARSVPDSVRRAFHTGSGRVVMDGHGIEPDISVGEDDPSGLVDALERRAAFFLFANHYAALHEDLPPLFEVTDATVADFRHWLDAEDFSYVTDAERDALTLVSALDSSGYVTAVDEAEALVDAVRAEKKEDFSRSDDAIRKRLFNEIITRYSSDSEQIRALLRRDPVVKEAVRVLKNEPVYTAALAP